MAVAQEIRIGLKGGGFLLEDVQPEEVFIPEDFSEEHRMMARTVEEFVTNNVLPVKDRMEQGEHQLTPNLLRRAASLGLCGIEVPEKYGGLGLDKASMMLVVEKITSYASFATSYGAHTGIGTLPIVYFGTEEQKRKYLPKSVTAELIFAYALTEPGAGSDALAARTKAVLSPDGKSYILNGTKRWISNAGFADVFITFAKVDGEKFSCFIVEKEFPGVSTGAEEKKMGLKGSSTRELILEDARVPVENLLGEVGKGHKIAFGTLNMGRFKLGAGSVGTAKTCIGHSARYAQERHQFGRSISSFGAIQEKLGEMAVRTFVAESMVYRAAGLLDAARSSINLEDPQEALKAVEEYAIECAAVKVLGSEILDYVVDEAVQIFGGYGYSAEYPVEMIYRDTRINRIFEGTNEINRLLIMSMLLKRAMKGQLPLMAAAQKLQDEILAFPSMEEADTLLGREQQMVRNLKKIVLFAAGLAVQKYMTELEEQQEILSRLSDIVMETWASESAVLRTQKMAAARGEEKAGNHIRMTQVYVQESVARAEDHAGEILAAVSEGETLRSYQAVLRRLAKFTPVNTIQLRRSIAEAILKANRYPF